MVTVLTRRVGEVDAGEMPRAPDPEVPEQAKRRRFTAAYKARIIAVSRRYPYRPKRLAKRTTVAVRPVSPLGKTLR